MSSYEALEKAFEASDRKKISDYPLNELQQFIGGLIRTCLNHSSAMNGNPEISKETWIRLDLEAIRMLWVIEQRLMEMEAREWRR